MMMTMKTVVTTKVMVLTCPDYVDGSCDDGPQDRVNGIMVVKRMGMWR